MARPARPTHYSTEPTLKESRSLIRGQLYRDLTHNFSFWRPLTGIRLNSSNPMYTPSGGRTHGQASTSLVLLGFGDERRDHRR